MRIARLAAIAAAAVVTAFTVTPTPGSAQSAVSDSLTALIPRVPDGKPDLSGIWQALVPANWDIQYHAARPGAVDALGALGAEPPSLGIVEGGEIPYQDWAKAKQQENYAQRIALDTEVKCFMPGVPRATYLPHPFQIFQSDEYVMLAYQYASTVRTVHMNDPGPAPTSFWMGWSVGHWEGDTLVVDVTKQKAETWFDRAGNFHSPALKVVERYTPMGPNHLRYEATIDDPEVFTRPWTISLPLYRRVEDNARLLEFKCIPFAEEVLYGHLRRNQEADESASEQEE
jgi:hypothetical protein